MRKKNKASLLRLVAAFLVIFLPCHILAAENKKPACKEESSSPLPKSQSVCESFCGYYTAKYQDGLCTCLKCEGKGIFAIKTPKKKEAASTGKTKLKFTIKKNLTNNNKKNLP